MNLEPLRRSLADRGREEARAILDAARREADERRAAARAEAEALLGQAEAERDADVAAAQLRNRLRARREASAIVLRARRAACDRLGAEAHAAVAGLRARPSYPRLVERLAATAREQLGPEAEVTEPVEGGIVACAGERMVDYSLPAMADRCLAALGPAIEELWT